MLLPTDSDLPLAFGIGWTEPVTGRYDVYIPIKARNLPLGDYRVRTITGPLAPPIVQDTMVKIEPDRAGLIVLGSTAAPGSPIIHSRIIYINASNTAQIWQVAGIAFNPLAPQVANVLLPEVPIPQLPTIEIPQIPGLPTAPAFVDLSQYNIGNIPPPGAITGYMDNRQDGELRVFNLTKEYTFSSVILGESAVGIYRPGREGRAYWFEVIEEVSGLVQTRMNYRKGIMPPPFPPGPLLLGDTDFDRVMAEITRVVGWLGHAKRNVDMPDDAPAGIYDGWALIAKSFEDSTFDDYMMLHITPAVYTKAELPELPVGVGATIVGVEWVVV